MRTSRPPFIAAWILYRFASGPETEAIAGDLLEQYQQGRSRLWYWREVIVAILTGAWSDVQQHSLLLLVAMAMGWTVDLLWQWALTPFEYSFIVRYILGAQARPDQIPFVGFLIVAPLAVLVGWTVARCARRCRIPAIFGFLATVLSVDMWGIWKNGQIFAAHGYHVDVWASLWPIPLTTLLVLLGGGLLTGSPKRSIRTQR